MIPILSSWLFLEPRIRISLIIIITFIMIMSYLKLNYPVRSTVVEGNKMQILYIFNPAAVPATLTAR